MKAQGKTAARPALKKTKKSTKKAKPELKAEECVGCQRSLQAADRALFVEEELGRIFCSEDCISAYFSPEVERLEKEYLRKVSHSDLTAEERENLAHLRWITLEEPDEIWREKTLTGDYRYTLISEFKPGPKPVWCVCLSLFLRGEPSFLFLAFVTKNEALAHSYRKGERMEWVKVESKSASQLLGQMGGELATLAGDLVAGSQSSDSDSGPEAIDADMHRETSTHELMGESVHGETAHAGGSDASGDDDGEDQGGEEVRTDGLAEAFTEDESYRAQVNANRKQDDIPESSFEQYVHCLEPTLETPDEVWSVEPDASGKPSAQKTYQFIKRFEDSELGAFWYIVLARETDEEEQIELIESYPTLDGELVECFRRGLQEVGEAKDNAPQSRFLH